MSNIIYFSETTTLAIPLERVLDAAKERLADAVVVGIDENDELYCASSLEGINEAIVLLDRARLHLLNRFED